MILTRSSLVCVALLSVLATERCKPANPTGDKTPPGFLQVVVRLENPADIHNIHNDIDITSQDATRNNLESVGFRGVPSATVAGTPDTKRRRQLHAPRGI